MNVLQANNIDFKYAAKSLFTQASLTVEPGQIVGLLGPNGSGKTTFFDLVCGLKQPNSGQLINTFPKQLYLSQTVITPPALRMFDIFKMMTLLCSSTSMIKDNTLDKLACWSPQVVERYNEIWSKKSSLCSYGEKRWFFTVSLLSIDADLFILDEPTAGVDPEFRFYIWQCLRAATKGGTAILVSSHNVDEISQNCDGFYMISQQQFMHFENGDAFKRRFQAATLDRAFINAAASSHQPLNGVFP